MALSKLLPIVLPVVLVMSYSFLLSTFGMRGAGTALSTKEGRYLTGYTRGYRWITLFPFGFMLWMCVAVGIGLQRESDTGLQVAIVLAALFAVIICSWHIGVVLTTRITFDAEGISCIDAFRERHIRWQDVDRVHYGALTSQTLDIRAGSTRIRISPYTEGLITLATTIRRNLPADASDPATNLVLQHWMKSPEGA